MSVAMWRRHKFDLYFMTKNSRFLHLFSNKSYSVHYRINFEKKLSKRISIIHQISIISQSQKFNFVKTYTSIIHIIDNTMQRILILNMTNHQRLKFLEFTPITNTQSEVNKIFHSFGCKEKLCTLSLGQFSDAVSLSSPF